MAIIMGIIGFTACSIGMIIGGVFAAFFKRTRMETIPIIFSLCSGLIVGLVLLEIIPDSIELGGWISTLFGLISGVILFRYLHEVNHIISRNIRHRFVRTGMILATGIALHNFFSGIALGASFKGAIANSMFATLILHTIPEGIAVFTPLFMARFGILILLPVTIFVAFPVGIGAMIGSSTELRAPWMLALLISLSMGIVLLVTIKEILGEAIQKAPLIYCISASIIGFLLIWSII